MNICNHEWVQISFELDEQIFWCSSCGCLRILQYHCLTGEYVKTLCKTPNPQVGQG